MSNTKTNTQSTQAVPESLARVKNIIAVGSGKGGVGKSTVTANLALALQSLGAKTAVLDADLYGPTQPRMLGADAKPVPLQSDKFEPIYQHGIGFMSLGLLVEDDAPVIWRAPLAMQVINQFINNVTWGDLDYLLIDMPPGTGDVQLTLAQKAALTGAVIVTTPQDVAIGITKKGLKMFQKVNVPILGIVENMSGFSCKKCGEINTIFKQGGGERMAEEFGVAFLGAVPLDAEIVSSADQGIPVCLRQPDSASAAAFQRIAQNLQDQVAAKMGCVNTIEPKDIEQAPEGGLVLHWLDGQTTPLSAYDLRLNCSCADCVNEKTGERLLIPNQIPLKIKINQISRVGRYGLSVQFSDGHNTGIYSFQRLKEQRVVVGADPCVRPLEEAKEQGCALPTATIEERVKEVLETHVNPMIASHGGSVDLIKVQGTSVYVSLQGACRGCMSAQATLKNVVESAIMAHVPEVTEIVDATEI